MYVQKGCFDTNKILVDSFQRRIDLVIQTPCKRAVSKIVKEGKMKMEKDTSPLFVNECACLASLHFKRRRMIIAVVAISAI